LSISEHEQHSRNIEFGLDLRTQVAIDLKVKLQEYRSERIGLRLIAERIGINEKTLRRLIKKENRPTYNTLLKIYRFLLSTTDDSVVVELAPKLVSDEIKKLHPNDFSVAVKQGQDVEALIANDPCFAEIYVLAGCGVITKDLIQFRMGEMGIQTLDRMLKLKVLKRVTETAFILGENQASLSPETLSILGMNLVKRYFKNQNCDDSGQNFIGFYAEGIDDATYEEWLKIDEEAFKKKVQLTKKMKALGTRAAMTFMVTEQMK